MTARWSPTEDASDQRAAHADDMAGEWERDGWDEGRGPSESAAELYDDWLWMREQLRNEGDRA